MQASDQSRGATGVAGSRAAEPRGSRHRQESHSGFAEFWRRLPSQASSALPHRLMRNGRPNHWLLGIAVTLPLVLVAAGCGSAAPSPTAVRVVRGTVARTVSATGTLQPISEQKLAFAKGGKLVAVMVSVGQQVKAGQVLAHVDDFDAEQDLQEAQAKLGREQARLAEIQDSNKADAARDDAGHAKDILDATKDQSDTINEANDRAVQEAQDRLETDRAALRDVQREAAGDQDRCNRSLTGGAHRYSGYGDYTDLGTKDRKGLLLESPLDPKSPSCTRAEKGKSVVAAYQRRVENDQHAIANNQRRADVDHAEQQVSLQNAKRDAAAADDDADGKEATRPDTIDEQQANVADARTDLRRAQREITDTTLTAPVAGTVASINGAVGEYLGAGGGTTAMAPGARAALPDLDSAASSSSNSGGNTPQPPGGDSFITLKNVDTYQIVVPFEETDAALVQPNQKATVTFDALPGLTRDGTVTSIAPTGTQIQDVNNYYATIVLNNVDPRLRAGMTTEARVVVGGVNNTLVVPTAAIQRGGNSGIVQVLQPDGTTRQVQVQLGMIGDTTTQIVDGLTEGQQVVISQS
jgi:HlyD family secretion protein